MAVRLTPVGCAEDTDTNRIVIGRNGGIETLLRTLEAHPYNPELCHIGFGALSNIAINSAHHHEARPLFSFD